MTTSQLCMYQSNMADETNCSLMHLKLNKSFIHFDNVLQPLVKITQTHLKKFSACRKRLAKFEGLRSAICHHLYELSSDKDIENHFSCSNCCGELNWHYHQNCYKRICDENKLKKAEEKGENLIGSKFAETGPPKKLSRR